MKKVTLLICFILATLFAFATDVPKLNNYVNDYGNLLSISEKDQLNQMLKTHEDSTSNQLFVLTLLSYNDVIEGSLFDFSMKVFKEWKIGQKTKKNGVLFVVIKNLASKNAPGLRIVTGYGLEGSLPDATCKRIIESVRPLINNGNYYQGIHIAIQSMITNIKDEFTHDVSKEKLNWTLILIIIVIIVIIIIILVWISEGNSSSSRSYYSSSNYSSSSSSTSSSSFDGGGGDSGGGGAGD